MSIKDSSVCKLQKPFLKWVGGKTQIIDKIITNIPKEMYNYHESFLGGGSVLFAILSLIRQNKIVVKNKIYAYDINSRLINVYKDIQKNKDELFKVISTYTKEYDEINGSEINRKPSNIQEAKTSKESYYYWIRNKYNNINIIDNNTVEISALFIIINKLCFRGMYREGPNGYNVPYGHYKKTPNIITLDELNNISNLIKDVEFRCCCFNESFKNISEGDFVYLDPPYAPENKKSFVGYIADGFDLDMHKKLFNEIIKLDEKKCMFLMSNSYVDSVIEKFKNFKCENIVARRAINSKKPESTTKEVLITNL
tara:strand:- start:2863 stop:3795 length:933 start_codon:yes stop_codon:yes gene_type:complete